MSQQLLDELAALRHSCAHLLAKAVLTLWPGSHNAIGPSIENGFYQDFDLGDVRIADEDLAKIEAEMKKILPSWKHFTFQQVTLDEAKKLFAHNPYKLELAEEFATEGKKLTTNDPGNFLDLCKMGHVENPSKELKHFKLQSIAGAYWRGSEKNKMLTRIYGTAFFTQEELDAHLLALEDAKNRDHRKLGAELGLFVFSDLVGKGLPLWTPKGSIIRREIEQYIVAEEVKRGYLHVYTPDLAKVDLYRTSGHYPYYKDTMYAPIKIDEEEFMLRPMTCPHHFELYKSSPHSYKELPMRIAELAQLYRYEKSGELTGLMRVRSFCLADAHIIATKEMAAKEIHNVLDLIEDAAAVFGLKTGENYRFRLSLGNRSDAKKYFKDDKAWDGAEEVLRKALQSRKANFFEAADEAAFYGPKIDVQMKNISGKEDTAFTVQYDFVMPKRFGLKYVDQDGTEKEPIVIHRSSIGAIERIMGFLIEHYGGAFPLWLSPLQVAIVPISQDQDKYAHSILGKLKAAGLRVENWNEAESMQNRIRKAEAQKIPYIVVVGKREEADETMSVRRRGRKDDGLWAITEWIEKVKKEVVEKRIW